MSGLTAIEFTLSGTRKHLMRSIVHMQKKCKTIHTYSANQIKVELKFKEILMKQQKKSTVVKKMNSLKSQNRGMGYRKAIYSSNVPNSGAPPTSRRWSEENTKFKNEFPYETVERYRR